MLLEPAPSKSLTRLPERETALDGIGGWPGISSVRGQLFLLLETLSTRLAYSWALKCRWDGSCWLKSAHFVEGEFGDSWETSWSWLVVKCPLRGSSVCSVWSFGIIKILALSARRSRCLPCSWVHVGLRVWIYRWEGQSLNLPELSQLDSPLFEGWEWVGRCGDLTWKNAGDFVFPVWDGLGSASQTQIDTCSLWVFC